MLSTMKINPLDLLMGIIQVIYIMDLYLEFILD